MITPVPSITTTSVTPLPTAAPPQLAAAAVSAVAQGVLAAAAAPVPPPNPYAADHAALEKADACRLRHYWYSLSRGQVPSEKKGHEIWIKRVTYQDYLGMMPNKDADPVIKKYFTCAILQITDQNRGGVRQGSEPFARYHEHYFLFQVPTGY